jgi:hypothetical protein
MAENSQEVIPDNLIIVDGEIGGGVPSSSASDAGKVLAVDSNGDPSWVTPSGGTLYTEGNGIDISDQNVVSIDTSVVATKSDLPASDELLPSATSSDEGKVLTIDSQGDAGWATPASVDEVPAVTSNDDGKVLKATYSGGVGSYAWATESGGGSSYTAGTGIDITNDTISVDNTVALKTDIPAKGSLMVKNGTTQKELYDAWAAGWTIQSNHGNEIYVYDLTKFDDDFGEYTATFSLITFSETTVSETSFVISGIASSTSAVSFGATTRKRTNRVPEASSQTVGKVLTIKSVPDDDPIASWETPSGGTQYSAGSGIDITNDTISVDTTVVATQTDIGNVRQVPSSTSSDENKVLTVNSSGNPVWATAQGGTTYTAGNMISLANDAVAVSTTAGITDIQLVNALPASPVATVLYLIPET